jgi:Suppressor of fused protein (SUFU)
VDVPEHIEKYLGNIEYGWSLANEAAGFQIVKVSNQPAPAVTTYSTLGMSRTKLIMPKNRVVRQELIFSAFEGYNSPKIASFLLNFGDSVLRSGRALLRGDVLGPYSSLTQGAHVNFIYCTVPVMFDSRLATMVDSDPATVFVWLMPITDREAQFVKSNGWSKFEDILETSSPNFWDLDRPSMAGAET